MGQDKLAEMGQYSIGLEIGDDHGQPSGPVDERRTAKV
jgi:hypothetical protein